MFANRKRLAQLSAVIAVGIMLAWDVFSARQISSSSVLQEGEPANDGITILKPGESADFRPTPVPDLPLPADLSVVTPGQTPMVKTRPSQEALEKLAQRDIPPDALYDVYAVVDAITDSKMASEYSEAIVLAKVSKIHPSSWNTADGKRPKNPYDPNHPSYIYTLVDVQVEQPFLGNVQSGETLTLFKNGGQIGKEKLVVESYHTEFTEGQLLLLYIDQIPVEERTGIFWRVNERYTIDPVTSIASTPFEERTLADLVVEINEAKQIRQQQTK